MSVLCSHNVIIHLGDCLDVLPTFESDSIDAVVTDAPYGLGDPPPVVEVLTAWLAGQPYVTKGSGFMGQSWDAFVPGPEVWRQVFRVLKPGGHLLSFFGSRTYHLGTIAVELAGFEIRDEIMWVYGQGFPHGTNVGKDIDKRAGAERTIVGSKLGTPGYHLHPKPKLGPAYKKHLQQVTRGQREAAAQITAPATPEASQWEGWNTTLKPSHEPIVVARKPFPGTVAENVLKHGTGAINVGACRVEVKNPRPLIVSKSEKSLNVFGDGLNGSKSMGTTIQARWPSNLIHDGSEEVEEAFAAFGKTKDGVAVRHRGVSSNGVTGWGAHPKGTPDMGYGGGGSASRFFYTAKVSRRERENSLHPTMKPLALMRWLVRLVTPPEGTVLDIFGGSGTTGVAAQIEGFRGILIERDPQYVETARRRCGLWQEERDDIDETPPEEPDLLEKHLGW